MRLFRVALVLLLACEESSPYGDAPECSARVFEAEVVFTSFCVYDGGIKGDCAAGICLPDRDWTSDSSSPVSCRVEWWVPLEPASDEVPGGCDARPYLRRIGRIDEFNRELCELPLEVPGAYQPPGSAPARIGCGTGYGGALISLLPEDTPPPDDTFVKVSCWSDTCDD